MLNVWHFAEYIFLLSGYNFPKWTDSHKTVSWAIWDPDDSVLEVNSQCHHPSRYLYWHITHIQAKISFSLWGCSCKIISGELVWHGGRRALPLNWLNPAKEKLTAASLVMFVPLATRLASEWPADLLLLESTVSQSQTDLELTVTSVMSRWFNLQRLEPLWLKSPILSGTIHCFSHESPTIIS